MCIGAIKCSDIEILITSYNLYSVTIKRNNDRSSGNYSQSRHRAKRMCVNMCLAFARDFLRVDNNQ